MTRDEIEALLPCPFCGSDDIDADFALSGDGTTSPGCMKCGATAPLDIWNTRAAALKERATPSSDARAVAEKCAEICEVELVNRPDDPPANYFDGGLRHCAELIRAYAATLPQSAPSAEVPTAPSAPAVSTKDALEEHDETWWAGHAAGMIDGKAEKEQSAPAASEREHLIACQIALAMELGYKACERGENLQAAIARALAAKPQEER